MGGIGAFCEEPDCNRTYDREHCGDEAEAAEGLEDFGREICKDVVHLPRRFLALYEELGIARGNYATRAFSFRFGIVGKLDREFGLALRSFHLEGEPPEPHSGEEHEEECDGSGEEEAEFRIVASEEGAVVEGFDEIGSSYGFLEDIAVGCVDLDFDAGFEGEFGDALFRPDVDSLDLIPGLNFEFGVLLEGLEHLLGANS